MNENDILRYKLYLAELYPNTIPDEELEKIVLSIEQSFGKNEFEKLEFKFEKLPKEKREEVLNLLVAIHHQ